MATTTLADPNMANRPTIQLKQAKKKKNAVSNDHIITM